MIRRLTDITYLYLCQTADWQCIVEAEDEETAATLAVEKAIGLEEDGEERKFGLTASILVKRIHNNLYYPAVEIEDSVFEFYCPMILANAGFHSEAKSLEDFLQTLPRNEDHPEE